MRTYGSRFLKKAIERRVENRVESRDGIIISYDLVNRYAVVKIQGSSKQIRVFFPQNWTDKPSWLAVGNSVRISHTGGQRGRLEITGHGQYRVTPISGDTSPSTPTASDAVLSGGKLFATNQGDMTIAIESATVRFSGVTYSISGLTMDNASVIMDMPAITLDSIGGVWTLTAPAAGTYRYDIFVVGSDLVIDVVSGTESSTPTMPATPSGHLLLDWVLLYGGQTEIIQADIHNTWTSPAPSYMEISITDNELTWIETNTEVIFTVKDQYGNQISIPGGTNLTFTIQTGNGLITSGGDSSTSSLTVGINDGANFTYTREGLVTDSSPILSAVTEFTATVPALSAGGAIILYDSTGGIMT